MFKKIFGSKSEKKKAGRSLESLIDNNDPAWPIVSELIREAKIDVEVLSATQTERESALIDTQVTTRSPMGALIYETGGLFVDSNWLRILGSDNSKMGRSLPGWNKKLFPQFWDGESPPSMLIVADDVVGGIFAVNGGALGADLGRIYYFSPDSLNWEPMDLGYSEFLQWSLSGQTSQFYSKFRWESWQSEVRQANGAEGFSFYPFLWAEAEGLASRRRAKVPLYEIFQSNIESKAQMQRP